MGRANLQYYIKDKSLVVYSDLLNNVDKFTSKFKSEKDLYQNLCTSTGLEDFVEQNNSKGYFKILYFDRAKLRVIPVLYNSDEIEVDDVHEYGIVSESEKARKKLLNSKEQLYSKLFLLNSDVDSAKKLSIGVSYEEYKLLNRLGIYTYKDDESYYVSIEDLIKYRATHNKLGILRELYEEALDIWKERMDTLPYDDIYFLSREYKAMDNSYHKILEKGISVINLNIKKKNIPLVNGKVKLSSKTPYVLNKAQYIRIKTLSNAS